MKRVKYIFLTALLAGTLDMLAAVINFKLKGGGDPLKIPIFIASGVFGKTAFQGQSIMIFYGTLFHYLIAGIWVTIFFMVYAKIIPKMNKYLSGVIYGIIVWLVMNLIVVPLSFTPPLSNDLLNNVVGMLILIVAIGLPTSILYAKTVGNS